jgi:polysaccharide biosynthesis/export protein
VKETSIVVTLIVPFCLALAFAQAAPQETPPETRVPDATAPKAPAPQPASSVADADYRIGVDDELSVVVLQAPELNATVRVSDAGDVSLPLLGTMRALGLSSRELELAIEARLQAKYIREPDVSVQVTEVRSREVTVVGAVRKPGPFQISGATTILEVLSLAGGLAEDAGESALVMRTGAAAAAPIEVKLKALMEGRDGHANIPIHPGDVVNVQSAAMVYVVGAINKPGAFAVPGNGQLTVLRALALGEGLTAVAAKGDALVVRTTDQGERVEIPVDLADILAGTGQDIPLEGQDVLFVPTSGSKVAARVTYETLVRIVSFRPW